MKLIGAREAKEQFSACLDASQEDRVVVLRHGKPTALIVGVHGQDLEDIYWGSDPELLRQVEAGRRVGLAGAIPMDEVDRAENRRQRRVR